MPSVAGSIMPYRICKSCGFTNVEEGKACTLCGVPAIDELDLPDVLAGDDTTGTPASPGPEGARRDRYPCPACAGAFAVVYEALPGEDDQPMPVACPHCWHTSQARVAQAAAETEDYHVEKDP